MNLTAIMTIAYAGFTAAGVTILLILNRRERIKNCKHKNGWLYRDFKGTRIKVSHEKLLDINTISFNRVVCKGCGKTLAEINF